MSGYAKVHSTILDSSLWEESAETRLVWITMLVMAGPGGLVEATASAIARRARVSKESAISALDTLARPDPESRTSDHDGRRIEKVEGGWLILNHSRYRERGSSTERVRRFREQRNGMKRDETVGNAETPSEAEAEAEAEIRSSASPPDPTPCSSRGTRVPEDWQPSEQTIAWAATADDVRFSRSQVLSCVDKFRDYWLSKAGRDACKIDWDRTYRNELRKQREFHPDWPRVDPDMPTPTARPAATSSRSPPATQAQLTAIDRALDRFG